MKATISIHPYRREGWKGWVISIEDPDTSEIWQRPFYYKVDAKQLKDDLEDKSLEEILDIYGTHYFEQKGTPNTKVPKSLSPMKVQIKGSMSKTALQKEAWTYKVRGEQYEYEYHIESQDFFWHGYADSSTQAKIKGWEAFINQTSREAF